MLNMNRPERLDLFWSLLFGGGVGGTRGEVDAPGHVCGEQFVTWPQSQLKWGTERGLSAACSAFHVLTGSGATVPVKMGA